MKHGLKIGLLGIDAQIASALSAVQSEAADALTVSCHVSSHEFDTFLIGHPEHIHEESWESLFDDTLCDVVFVGSDHWTEQRADAVRGLVQAGRTLLLSHPLQLSMLWAYELDMIRNDSAACLIPFLPERLHPWVGRLAQQIHDARSNLHPKGPIESITFERHMPERSRELVLCQLARDLDLIRLLMGDPQRISTLGGTVETAWPTLTVGLSVESQIPVRWNVLGNTSSSLNITLTQIHGTTRVHIPTASSSWEWYQSNKPTPEKYHPVSRGQTMLDAVRQALASASNHVEHTPPATWTDAARCIEIAETIPRSLMKGRSIDLHQEEFSEIGTFKGTMASLGCGIVLAGLFVLILASLVGGIAREAQWAFGEQIASMWPVIVLTALMLFLGLQILPSLVKDTDTPASEKTQKSKRGP
ncbi:MAG: hypothetical protein ABGW78_10430 [Pirellulales bacterium]